jgi:hypothetical protein
VFISTILQDYGSRHDFGYSTLAAQVGSTFDVSVVFSIIFFPFGLFEC